MKLSTIVVMAALLVAGAAQAGGYATFEYSNETKRVDDSETVKSALVAGYKTADNMDYSIKMESSQAEWGNGSISNGIEVRAKKTFNTVLGVNPYFGARLGEKIKSDEKFSHYAFDTGVKFPIMGALSGDVGVRYRNAFDTVNAFQSTRYHVIAAYALTKQDSVAIRYSQAYGNVAEEKNAYRVSYTRSF